MANDDTSALIADLNRQIGSLSGTMGQQAKATGLASAALIDDAKQEDDMAKAQKELANAIQRTTQSAVSFTKSLQGGGGSFQPLTEVVSITTKALGSLLGKLPFVGGALEGLSKGAGEVANLMIETYDKVYGSFEKLSDSGVVDSFTTMKSTALAMGMSMTAASDSLQKRSKELALFGGSALQGTKMFKLISAGSENLRVDFQKLGVSSQDFTDFQISYINQQTLLNNGKKQSNEQLIAGSADYIKELDAVAKLTGESRKELQKEREARLNDASILAGMKQFGPEMQKQLHAYLDKISATGGKEASRAIGLAIVRNGLIIGEESKKFQSASPDLSGVTQGFFKTLKEGSFNTADALMQTGKMAKSSEERNRTLAMQMGPAASSTGAYVSMLKLSTLTGKDQIGLDKDVRTQQAETMKDQTSDNARLAETKRSLEKSQINIEQLATSSRLVTGLMNAMAEGIEKFTEKFYEISGEDIPAHLKASSEARKAIKAEMDTRQKIQQAEKKELKLKAEGKSENFGERGLNLDQLDKLRKKLAEQTKKKDEALERKKQEDIKAGLIVGGASTTTTDEAAAPSSASTAAPTTGTVDPQSRTSNHPVDVREYSSPDGPAPGQPGAAADNRNERGVKQEVLAKKAQLESMLGKKLVITSGFRRGVANHGSGDAIDLGFGANPSLRNTEEQNKLFKDAIGLGFKGIGAEFNAPGGAHIHLDTTPSRNGVMGWGSDYTSKSLPRDSPYLANLINQQRRGGGTPSQANVTRTGGAPTSPANSARTGGIFSGPDSGYLTELHGDEIVAPVGKQALNTSMLGATTTSASDEDFSKAYEQLSSKMDNLISVMNDTMKANKKQSQARFV